METKEIKIEVPEGYEIDEVNSTFECVRFKPKQLTYKDVANNLLSKVYGGYYLDKYGNIHSRVSESVTDYSNPVNAFTRNQLKKLLAINKLMNVAIYLNDGWKPNFEDSNEFKWSLLIFCDEIKSYWNTVSRESIVYFKSKELAEQAIEILGEDVIRLALSTI